LSDPIVNIVGVGNTLMGDDGVGPVALEAICRRGVGVGVRLHDAGLAVSDVLGQLDPNDPLIIIDALRAGGEPGTVYKATIDEPSLWGDTLVGQFSLHELSIAPALRIEAMTGREFVDVTAFGVEPEVVQWGAPLSDAVTGALEKLTAAVLAHAEAKLNSAAAGAQLR